MPDNKKLRKIYRTMRKHNRHSGWISVCGNYFFDCKPNEVPAFHMLQEELKDYLEL